MSSLKNRLEEQPTPKSCKFTRVYTTLTREDQAVLDTAMQDREGFPTRKIARALQAEGHTISHSTIQDHRDGRCTCFRSPFPKPIAKR